MPLLNLEPYVFPQNLFTEGVPAGDWWALHTRPRAEKALARKLLARGAAFFLPLYHRQWRTGGRLRSSYLPLFPGYMFLHGESQARLRALETNLVVRALEVEDQARLHEELKRVYQLVVSGAPLSPEDRLQPGTAVEVISGPLAGMTGKIVRRGKQLRFFVEVEILKCGVSIEMESRLFRPLS